MNNPLKIKRTSPLKMMAPLIVFVCIALAWSVYWYIALGTAKHKLATLEASHVTLQCNDRSWGGYPFRIHFDCTGVAATLAGTRITADKLRLIGQAWNPNHVIGALFGPVSIDTVKISGDPIRFSYRASAGKLAIASLLAENQTIRFTGNKQLAVTKTETHIRPSATTDQLDLAIILSGVSIATAKLDSFIITGTLNKEFPKQGSFDAMSEPSDYLDALLIVQYLTGLGDTEMNAAQAIIRPLLRSNDNKLPIQIKDQTWYWGPFAIAGSD